MEKYRIGFIGYGNMASAIISKIAAGSMRKFLTGESAELDIILYDQDAEKLKSAPKEAEGVSVRSARSIDELKGACDYIVFAVKPQNAEDIFVSCDLSDKIIISIMAGKNIAWLKDKSGAEKVVRVMPNLNAKIGESFNAYASEGLSEPESRFIAGLLNGFGRVLPVSENKMNAVTGLSGSGPAFVFMFVKAFVETAVELGFTESEARIIAESTIVSSAKNVLGESEKSIEEMILAVCSKGGTTIEGVNHLREKDFENTVSTAIKKAAARASELEGR